MKALHAWIVALLLQLIITVAWANDSINLNDNQPHWYASLGVGESFDYRAGEGSYIYFPPSNPQLSLGFSPHYNASPLYFQGELGYVWTQPFTRFTSNNLFLPFMSLGVQYRYTKPITVTTAFTATDIATSSPGPVLPLPYRIEQESVLLNWKIDIYRWLDRVMPYLALGLGTSWNRTSQVIPINPDPEESGTINTYSNTNTDLSYSIGIGLDFIVTTNFWLSLGYSYDNFGRLQLGNVFLTPDPLDNGNQYFSSVNIGNLHAHNILFTARYLFA